MSTTSAQVFEVGPRDGLQSEPQVLRVEERAELILKLLASGLRDVEVGSFVRNERVPQLANTEAVVKLLAASPLRAKSRLWAFIPNESGLESALAAGLDGASFFVGASPTFCLRNVNRTQADLLKAMGPLLKKARKHRLKNRVYLSTSFHCPYEGVVDVKTVLRIVDQLLDEGVSQIALSDTTGWAHSKSVHHLLERILKKHSPRFFALHFHDTRGQALANTLVGLEHGIRTFDASIGGAGGCPYAPGATGNLSTEDLVFLLKGQGFCRGVDLEKLGVAGLTAERLLKKTLPSRMLQTLRS